MFNVARTVYISMNHLHYTEREAMFMTPRKYMMMLGEYLREHKPVSSGVEEDDY